MLQLQTELIRLRCLSQHLLQLRSTSPWPAVLGRVNKHNMQPQQQQRWEKGRPRGTKQNSSGSDNCSSSGRLHLQHEGGTCSYCQGGNPAVPMAGEAVPGASRWHQLPRAVLSRVLSDVGLSAAPLCLHCSQGRL